MFNRLKHFPSLILFLTVVFYPLTVHGDAETVRKNYEQFYDSLRNILGLEGTETFLRDWTFSDTKQFRYETLGLIKSTMMDGQQRPLLYQSIGPQVYQSLKRTFATIVFRKMTRDAGAIFVSSFRYNQMNHPRAGDELAITIAYTSRNDHLVIEGAGRIPTDKASFDPDLAKSVIEHWQKQGIFVGDSDPPAFFDPSKIKVRLSEWAIDLASLTAADLEKAFWITDTDPLPDCRGSFVPLPFNRTILREVTFAFLYNWSNSGQKFDGFSPDLVDWLVGRKVWPQKTGNAYEQALFDLIKRNDGNNKVFINRLDGALQNFCARHGLAPELMPFQLALRKADPTNPNVLSALKLFKRLYEKPGERQIEIFLSSYSANWKNFFDSNSIEPSEGESEIPDCLVKFITISDSYQQGQGKRRWPIKADSDRKR